MPTLPASASPLVSTEWLADHLADPNLQVIDGSWYLPAQNRDARVEYEQGHIPGAIFLDIDAVADQTSGLPHMLLDDAAFGREAGRLGISSATTLVVYDGSGLFSAPRVRWMLRLYGAREVVILEGGLPRWIAERRPLQQGPSRADPTTFEVHRAAGQVVDLAAMRDAVARQDLQILDARSSARFKGEAPEPRPGLPSGHMPGSLNLPFTAVTSDGRLNDPDTLRRTFVEAGVDLARPVVATCGSGVTAATLVLALETLGKRDVALYDGSWTEWASQSDSAIERLAQPASG